MHLLIRDGSIVASVYEKAEKEYGISTEREDITELWDYLIANLQLLIF